jgi:hypothetical protein
VRPGEAPLPPLPLPEVGYGDPLSACELDKPTNGQFKSIELRDVVSYLEQLHGLGMAIDGSALEMAGIPCDSPVTYNLGDTSRRGLPLPQRGLTLRCELQLLLEPLNLVPVLRHEEIVITTRASAREWRDTSGVEAIASDDTSRFAPALRRVAKLSSVEVSLRDVLAQLSKEHNIPLRLASDAPQELAGRLVTAYFGRVSVAAGLARLLEQEGLCCEDSGTELLITPLKGPAERETKHKAH